MKEIVSKLNNLIVKGENYLGNTSEIELEIKPFPNKWSKKEIFGHLIDSGFHNLQRFNEIQFHDSPYQLRDYNQNELVKSNAYQKSNIHELLHFWKSLNNRIQHVISNFPESLFLNEILLPSGKIITVQFLVEDYVIHLEYHLNQIVN